MHRTLDTARAPVRAAHADAQPARRPPANTDCGRPPGRVASSRSRNVFATVTCCVSPQRLTALGRQIDTELGSRFSFGWLILPGVSHLLRTTGTTATAGASIALRSFLAEAVRRADGKRIEISNTASVERTVTQIKRKSCLNFASISFFTCGAVGYGRYGIGNSICV